MGMDAGEVLRLLRQELEVLRAEYIANGCGDEFDRQIASLRAEGRYPFDA
jgi:hypothetical protein